jgi:predicted membrane protein
MVLAGSFTVSGAHGVLLLLALVCFLVAAIMAAVVVPLHRIMITLVALGLFFTTLAGLWTG